MGLASAAAAALARHAGCRVATMDLPELRHALRLWGAAMGGGRLREAIEEDCGRVSLPAAWAAFALGRSEHTLPMLAVLTGEALAGGGGGGGGGLAALAAATESLAAALGEAGVLLLPTHPHVAPPHDASLFSPLDYAYTALFNACGNPATAVQCGLGADGMRWACRSWARRAATRSRSPSRARSRWR